MDNPVSAVSNDENEMASSTPTTDPAMDNPESSVSQHLTDDENEMASSLPTTDPAMDNPAVSQHL